ncbi:amino acid ABC transporter [Paracoccus suum]|uniref:Amino acid ABC transporter n=1 Tax=Paracoccus suum TaxID=2259340 RepID=A0A344PI13_9RHOB|nr:transporter substrate-binding domain-containing protein [Paracoccus suum]AXC49018.1 amino acid ABC transporter [Paracoccus suum]
MSVHTTLKSALIGLAALGLTVTGALADQLDDIKAAGKITVATEMHYAPFDILENGQYVGFNRDLFDEIAKELGVTPEYQDLPWTAILPGLEVKKFDFVTAPVTYTPERAERYAFTAPISDATVMMVQKAGGALTKPEDAKGKTVGAQQGTAQLAQLEAFGKKIGGITIKEYASTDEAYADVAAGRLDAAVASAPLINYMVKQRPEVFAAVNPPFGDPTYFGFVARKEGTETLIKAINDAMAKMQADGRFAKIQEKWIGAKTELPTEMPKL